MQVLFPGLVNTVNKTRFVIFDWQSDWGLSGSLYHLPITCLSQGESRHFGPVKIFTSNSNTVCINSCYSLQKNSLKVDPIPDELKYEIF